MDFSNRTREIAFADDLLVLTRRKSALDAENYANQDLKKNWEMGQEEQNALMFTFISPTHALVSHTITMLVH